MLRDFPILIRSVAVALVGAALMVTLPLAGCGVKGPLKLPQPATTPTGALPSAPPIDMGPPAPAATSGASAPAGPP